MLYDSIIIGTGPAGLSAALNLKVREKSFLWFGAKALSDKIHRAERILNYPGLADCTGEQMSVAFKNQIEQMEIDINEATVTSIINFGTHFAVSAGPEFYEAKTVILATGVAPSAEIEGEITLLGKGVSYCATCDGGLYRGKTIAVISTSPHFEHEVKFLASLASKVYFFPRYKNASQISDNVEAVIAKISKINGESRVSGITLGTGDQIALDGIFCLRESVSLSALLPELEVKDGHITVDRTMSTNISGCFACGDCTGRPYQYAKAVGEGNIAAHSVIEFLSNKETKT